MDPNETLSLIRARIADLSQPDPADNRTFEDIATELSLLIDTLDDHLTHGGALPHAWEQRP